MTVTWNPYRGPLPKWRPAVLAAGIPGIPGTPAELSGRAVPVQPPPGSATPAWFATWAAAVQLWGTDNRPTNAAWFVPAETPPRFTPGTPAELNGTPVEPYGGVRGNQMGFPEPEPMGGNAMVPGSPPSATALMSDIDAMTAGSIIPGFIYPPETNPLTKLEFKKFQAGFGRRQRRRE